MIGQEALDIVEAGATHPQDVRILHEALRLAWQKLETRVRDRNEVQPRLARLIVAIGNRRTGVADAEVIARIAEKTFHPPHDQD